MESPEPAPSFDEDSMQDLGLWTLAHGLPDPPEGIGRSMTVPVARWGGPAYGAVLHVQWYWDPDDPDDDEYPQSEVQTYLRDGEGWEESAATGGSGWFDPAFARPAQLGSREVWFLGAQWSSSFGSWACCAVYGVAGSDAAWVEVDDADGRTRLPVESPMGAFVAATDGRREAKISVLDAAGEVLASTTSTAFTD